MTRGWTKRTWFFAILGVCLLILLFAGGTGISDDIRIVLHSLLGLLQIIANELLKLAGQLLDKIGK